MDSLSNESLLACHSAQLHTWWVSPRGLRHRIVVPVFVGSNPITHPIKKTLLLCRRVFFMEWTVRDSNNQMQQSGGLLPARAGPSRTFIFAKGENVNESHHPLVPYYLLSPHRNGHLGDIVAAAFAPVGRPFQIDGANGTCGFDALFLHIYGQRPNCLRNPLIWTAIIDA